MSYSDLIQWRKQRSFQEEPFRIIYSKCQTQHCSSYYNYICHLSLPVEVGDITHRLLQHETFRRNYMAELHLAVGMGAEKQPSNKSQQFNYVKTIQDIVEKQYAQIEASFEKNSKHSWIFWIDCMRRRQCCL